MFKDSVQRKKQKEHGTLHGTTDSSVGLQHLTGERSIGTLWIPF